MRAGAAKPASVYTDAEPLADKIRTVAQKIYKAAEVVFEHKALAQLLESQAAGYGHFPLCIAKTQDSFSTDAMLRGAPTGHSLHGRELRPNAGAEFVVAICGDIMTMPGLPKTPSAERIDVDDDGRISGLL